MATYAAYRHIELDNVGSGKRRVTKPPGGECSDIFNTGAPMNTPPVTPRKKNYMASTIFSPADAPLNTPRGRRVDDSFNKLFGEMAVTNGNEQVKENSVTQSVPTPRVVKDHQKSDIFFVAGESKKESSGTGPAIINGSPKAILGEAHDSASSSGNSSACPTPTESGTPSGSVNGDPEPGSQTNGHSNGHAEVLVSNGGTPKSKRIPPGGHCTKLW